METNTKSTNLPNVIEDVIKYIILNECHNDKSTTVYDALSICIERANIQNVTLDDYVKNYYNNVVIKDQDYIAQVNRGNNIFKTVINSRIYCIDDYIDTIDDNIAIIKSYCSDCYGDYNKDRERKSVIALNAINHIAAFVSNTVLLTKRLIANI